MSKCHHTTQMCVEAAQIHPSLTWHSHIEHQRLELQHRLFRQLMGNKILHVALEDDAVRKILDVGCGTGTVTHEMALMFPNAQVYGADLSPVPRVRPQLSNITYIQGNIMEIENTLLQKESFDLVFSRLLVLGMSNWRAYIESCVSLLKPGVRYTECESFIS